MKLQTGPKEWIKSIVLICLALLGRESISWQRTGWNPNVSSLRSRTSSNNTNPISLASQVHQLESTYVYDHPEPVCSTILRSKLRPGELLYSDDGGHFICSPNGKTWFGYDDEGDLSLWRDRRKVWSAETAGMDTITTMQHDGNLVVYRGDYSGDFPPSSDMALWSSNTGGRRRSYLSIEDDGHARIWFGSLSRTQSVVWSAWQSSTACKPINSSSQSMNVSFNGSSWDLMKQKLCPSMKPNIDLGRIQFLQAKRELGLEGTMCNLPPLRAFNAGGWSYKSGQLGEARATAYLRIFKAANNQILSAANFFQGKEGRYVFENQIRNLIARGDLNMDACIVTAIRDPVERFLSGYNEMEYRLVSYPKRLKRLDASTPFSFLRKERGTRFRQFLIDIISDVSTQRGYDALEFGHVWSMSGILHHLNRQGLRLTSYLPSLHNLTHKWPEFLASTCKGLPGSIKEPMPLEGQHESSSDPYGFYADAKHAWAEQEDIARALCAMNLMDYACYDKLAVPPICQEVFSDERLVSEILHSDDLGSV